MVDLAVTLDNIGQPLEVLVPLAAVHCDLDVAAEHPDGHALGVVGGFPLDRRHGCARTRA